MSGSVHVHESRREPEMLGCGPLSLRRHEVEVKKDKIKCCALQLASWHDHRYHVTQSALGCVIKMRPVYIHIVTDPLLNTCSGVFPTSQEHNNSTFTD